MDPNVGTCIVTLVLKGGPPWGFRIKQRGFKVIISKVNCGGRAYKNGLKVNDEVVAVNNLEVDKHQLGLARVSEDDGDQQALALAQGSESNQLSKLDFTYQLIKHTINRQLHLTVRRHSDSDVMQPYCYYIEDDALNEAYQLAELHSQSEEEILSPSEDLELPELHLHQTLVKPVIERVSTDPRPGPSSSRSLDHLTPSDLTPSDAPSAISPGDSEDESMPGVTRPAFKAKAPKNIWSPGSTTTSSSESTSTRLHPLTTASATQTTPTKSDTLPRGFRPIKLSSLQLSAPLPHVPPMDSGLLSPSTISEVSISTTGTIPDLRRTGLRTAPSPPSSPILKYWTLPRHISAGSNKEREEYQTRGEAMRHLETDQPPPAHARFLYESPTTKYYTLPTSSMEKNTFTVPAPPKYDGIGPLNEAGIPLSLRTGVKDEYASDWYKTMFKRLHKFERPRTALDEPLRVKLKSSKRDYRFDPNYFSEDEGSSGRRRAPRNIADYEPGHSSISQREKEMDTSTAEETNDGFINSADQRDHELEVAHQRQRQRQQQQQQQQRNSHHHRHCVFNALTAANGYESDSSFIIKKKEPKKGPTPATRTTYCAVQRGDGDIPLSGLQKPAPQPRAHKVGPVPPMLSPEILSDSALSPVPPKRPPPPFSEQLIDEWQHQITEDFDYIYQTLQKQEKSKQTDRSEQRQDFFRLLIQGQEQQQDMNQLKMKERSGVTEVEGKAAEVRKRGEETQKVARSSYMSGSYSTAAAPAPAPVPVPASASTPVSAQAANCGPHETEHQDDIDLLIRQIEGDINEHLEDDGRGSPHQFSESQVNIHYRAPVTALLKEDLLNEEELVKRQREQMRRYYEEEYERRATRASESNAQRKHHFAPTSDGHVVHLDRYQKAYKEKDSSQFNQIRLARVLFDFHALSPRELSAKKGDVVIIERPVNHNWVEVEDSQSGLKGLVPRNYLDYEQEGVAKAKFDFEAKTPVELPLKKGESLKLLRKVDENWYEGVNGKNEVGIFPCTYVETFKQPLSLQLNNNNTYLSPLSPGGESVSRSLSPVQPMSPSLGPPNRRHLNGSSAQRADDSYSGSSLSSGKPSKLYRVLYPYKPQQGDELELITGDILTVTMHCDDGWFVGHSTLTGQYGTFPGNYVEVLM